MSPLRLYGVGAFFFERDLKSKCRKMMDSVTILSNNDELCRKDEIETKLYI